MLKDNLDHLWELPRGVGGGVGIPCHMWQGGRGKFPQPNVGVIGGGGGERMLHPIMCGALYAAEFNLASNDV